MRLKLSLPFNGNFCLTRRIGTTKLSAWSWNSSPFSVWNSGPSHLSDNYNDQGRVLLRICPLSPADVVDSPLGAVEQAHRGLEVPDEHDPGTDAHREAIRQLFNRLPASLDETFSASSPPLWVAST